MKKHPKWRRVDGNRKGMATVRSYERVGANWQAHLSCGHTVYPASKDVRIYRCPQCRDLSKLRARWQHELGWELHHCGHPTALRPWLLLDPKGTSRGTYARLWDAFRAVDDLYVQWAEEKLRQSGDLV